MPAVVFGGPGGVLRSRPGAGGAWGVRAVGAGGVPVPGSGQPGGVPDPGTHPAGFGRGPEAGLGAREGPQWV